VFLTTALFNHLSKEVPSAFNSVRHLLFGGEAVDPRWVKRCLRMVHLSDCFMFMGLQRVQHSLLYLVSDVLEGATTIPIGRPLSNTQIYAGRPDAASSHRCPRRTVHWWRWIG